MANDAIMMNPSDSYLSITEHGSDWLWAVFSIMMFSNLVVFVWHLTIPRGQRIFHQLSMIILSTASIAYFCMASNLGSTPVATEFAHEGLPAGITRAIWYARYIDWVITTPALLLTLVLASGLPLGDIVTVVFFDELMIVTGLVGALVESRYKWAFWVFGTFALFYIWWVLAGPARVSARAISPEASKAFTMSAVVLSTLWLLYPIAWGLADGSSYITPDSEMVFYGVLDVFAKPVFCFIHLFALRKVDFTSLQLTSGKFSESAMGVSNFDREKNTRPVSAAEPGVKKGFFGKRGHYDATAPATTNNTIADPRVSTTTAVNA